MKSEVKVISNNFGLFGGKELTKKELFKFEQLYDDKYSILLAQEISHKLISEIVKNDNFYNCLIKNKINENLKEEHESGRKLKATQLAICYNSEYYESIYEFNSNDRIQMVIFKNKLTNQYFSIINVHIPQNGHKKVITASGKSWSYSKQTLFHLHSIYNKLKEVGIPVIIGGDFNNNKDKILNYLKLKFNDQHGLEYALNSKPTTTSSNSNNIIDLFFYSNEINQFKLIGDCIVKDHRSDISKNEKTGADENKDHINHFTIICKLSLLQNGGIFEKDKIEQIFNKFQIDYNIEYGGLLYIKKITLSDEKVKEEIIDMGTPPPKQQQQPIWTTKKEIPFQYEVKEEIKITTPPPQRHTASKVISSKKEEVVSNKKKINYSSMDNIDLIDAFKSVWGNKTNREYFNNNNIKNNVSESTFNKYLRKDSNNEHCRNSIIDYLNKM